MEDETKALVELHHRTLFGDPSNYRDAPGVIADQMKMSREQERTNEILTELRDAVMRINWMIIAGFITAIGSVIYKATGH
jgi:galactokinase/mevalonate kinase-like predicted kinase